MLEKACLSKFLVFIILILKLKTCWGLEISTIIISHQQQKQIFLKETFLTAVTPKIDIYLSQPQEVVQLDKFAKNNNNNSSSFQKIENINSVNNKNYSFIETSIENSTFKPYYYLDNADIIFKPLDDSNDRALNINFSENNEAESVEQSIKLDKSNLSSYQTVALLHESNNIEKIAIEVLKQIYFNQFSVPKLPIIEKTVFVTKTVFEPETEWLNNKVGPEITVPSKLEEYQAIKTSALSTVSFYFTEISKTRDPFMQQTATISKSSLALQTPTERKHFITGEKTKSKAVNTKLKDNDEVKNGAKFVAEGNNNLEDMLSSSNTQDAKNSATNFNRLVQKLKNLIKTTFVLSSKSIEKIDNRTSKNKVGNDMSLLFGKRSSENALLESAENLTSFDFIEQKKKKKETEYTNNNKALLSYNKYNSMMGAVIAIVMLSLLA